MRKIAHIGLGIASAFIIGALGGMSARVPSVNTTGQQTAVTGAENAQNNKTATNASQQTIVVTDNRILPGRKNDKNQKSTRYGRQPRQKMQKHTNRQRCKHNAKLKRRKK